MKTQNTFDAARVRHFREAIRCGRFQVDAGRVADRLIAQARRPALAIARAKRSSAPG